MPYAPPEVTETTVPDETALISVPVEDAISNPVCVEDLILLLTPNLEDIVPITGVTASLTPLITGELLSSSIFST